MADAAPVLATGDHPFAALIDPPFPPLDDLPHFIAVLENAAQRTGEDLQAHIPDPITVELSDTTLKLARDVLLPGDADPVTGIFSTTLFTQPVLAMLPRQAIDTLIEALFGGRGAISTPPVAETETAAAPVDDGATDVHQKDDIQARDKLSPIEHSVAGFIIAHLGKGLGAAFSDVLPAQFSLTSLMFGESTDELIDSEEEVVAAHMALTLAGQAIDLALLIPVTALKPMRARFAGGSSARPLAGPWHQTMQNSLGEVVLELRTILDEHTLTVDEIIGFAPGSTIPLTAGPEKLARVECEGQSLFKCRIGEQSGAYLLRVEEPVSEYPSHSQSSSSPTH